MVDKVSGIIDGTRLLVDLQQVDSIVKKFSGCLEPTEIAQQVTAGLVEKFGCVFARIWLMEPDGTALKLVASAGLYQRTDGFFARVAVGAFKVGKIAQNQIPFLSNHLATETWVLDPEWAIAHDIQGFAGYPLIVNGDSIGVLAAFSQKTMGSEFLEVLQSLCSATTIGLAAALRHQQEKQTWQSLIAFDPPPLSEQLAHILPAAQLSLIGTERPISLPLRNLFLQATKTLSQFPCIHSRLTYNDTQIFLETVVVGALENAAINVAFGTVQLETVFLGGTIEISPCADHNTQRVILSITSHPLNAKRQVNLRCCSSILQIAFAHLIDLAGLSIAPLSPLAQAIENHPDLPLLTDDRTIINTSPNLIWIATDHFVPSQAKGKVDLSIRPNELRLAIEQVMNGDYWGISPSSKSPHLSEREREIINHLTTGLRDRDIANQMLISESTVKFHINNILAKFKAKTRFQALYQALTMGLI
jgi:DNA-binding CsgD family transcriptional regulator